MNIAPKTPITHTLPEELIAELEEAGLVSEGAIAPTFTFRRLRRAERAELDDEMLKVNAQGTIESIRATTVRYRRTLARLSGWTGVRVNGQELAFNAAEKALQYDELPEQIQDHLEELFGQ